MEVSVCKVFSFDAAHYLPVYDGKCQNLHGHRWVLEVEVSGPVGENGMVVDFVHLKNLVNDEVINFLDHTCLNEVLVGKMEDSLGVVNPTCENLLHWIWIRLSPLGTWQRRVRIERLRLYETPDSFAEIRA